MCIHGQDVSPIRLHFADNRQESIEAPRTRRAFRADARARVRGGGRSEKDGKENKADSDGSSLTDLSKWQQTRRYFWQAERRPIPRTRGGPVGIGEYQIT